MALPSAYYFAGTATVSSVAFVPPLPAFISSATARAIGRGDTRGKQQEYPQLQLQLQFESARCSRLLRTMRMISEAEPGKSQYSDVSAQLLERARLAREEAYELEIQYRKERGMADIDTEEAQASGVTSVPEVPRLLVVKSTPETRLQFVARLQDLPPGSGEAIAVMEQLKSEGLTSRFVGKGRPRSQQELAADGGNMIDIKYALGIVCAGSFVCAVRSGSAIGGTVGTSFTYFFALLLIVFPAIGFTAPGIITAPINSFKMKSQEDYDEQPVRHEAAQVLSGYLCGLPIKSYNAEGGSTQVELYDSTSRGLEGKALKFTPDEVDKVSIVAMSGAMGEARSFGKAMRGAIDIDNLVKS